MSESLATLPEGAEGWRDGLTVAGLNDPESLVRTFESIMEELDTSAQEMPEFWEEMRKRPSGKRWDPGQDRNGLTLPL